MAEPRDRTVLLMIGAVLGGLFLCMVAGVFLLGFGFFFYRSAAKPAAAPPVMVVPQEAPVAPAQEDPLAPADAPPQKVPPPG